MKGHGIQLGKGGSKNNMGKADGSQKEVLSYHIKTFWVKAENVSQEDTSLYS